MNGLNDTSHVKNESTYNMPIVIDKNVTSSGITLLALWKTLADKSYQVAWPQDRLRPLIENSVIALYTKQGHGEMRLSSGEVLQLEGSTVIFLHPKDILSYECKGLIWEVFLMEFIPNGAINLVYGQQITLTNNEYFYDNFAQIIPLFEQEDPLHHYLAVSSLTTCIYHWLTLAQVSMTDKKLDQVQTVITQIHLNLTKKWTVSEMAELAGCSAQHLRKLFLKYTNQTPNEYYLNTRLNVSIILIKNKGYSINQVASELNFYDAFHFSKTFKKKFGYSPSLLTV
jgi:AraC-like DNA-binding protein